MLIARRSINNRWLVLLVSIFLWGTNWAWSSPLGEDDSIIGMSLEELMQVEIYSASKKAEKATDAPAAVFVITAEDIRRSGATSVPEVLRMAPGVQVARMNANKWAISIRGFNGIFSNKLLVLIDGRSVYNSVYSGVFWNANAVMLEDVDRIEVIRGPGGALWGANAVNGVINIRTKSAQDTQGTLIAAGGGDEDLAYLSSREGFKIGESGYARLWGHFYMRDDSDGVDGGDHYDDTEAFQGGFRSDWNLSDRDTLIVQGGGRSGKEEYELTRVSYDIPFTEDFRKDVDISGADASVRWEREISEGSDLQLQFSYARENRDEGRLDFSIDTYDLEAQHRFQIDHLQEIVWGLGYRVISDEIGGSSILSFSPQEREVHLFSGFFQDDIALVKNRLHFIIGSKFEHNDYTGFEVQPTARMLWTPDDRSTVWTAYSRAIRTPSRAESDLVADLVVLPLPDGSGLSIGRLFGDEGFDSEELNAFELGYRHRALDDLYYDIAAFYFRYDDLVTLKQGTPFVDTMGAMPVLVAPASFANGADGDSFGVELVLNYLPLENWTLQGSYSYLHRDLDILDSTQQDASNSGVRDPDHSVTLRSLLDLPYGFELDSFLRYVDSHDNLPSAFDLAGSFAADPYIELDVRLGWHASENIEVSVTGFNLLDNNHLEFKEPALAANSGLIKRAVFGKVTARF